MAQINDLFLVKTVSCLRETSKRNELEELRATSQREDGFGIMFSFSYRSSPAHLSLAQSSVDCCLATAKV